MTKSRVLTQKAGGRESFSFFVVAVVVCVRALGREGVQHPHSLSTFNAVAGVFGGWGRNSCALLGVGAALWVPAEGMWRVCVPACVYEWMDGLA